jgi:hypothetical protein
MTPMTESRPKRAPVVISSLVDSGYHRSGEWSSLSSSDWAWTTSLGPVRFTLPSRSLINSRSVTTSPSDMMAAFDVGQPHKTSQRRNQMLLVLCGNGVYWNQSVRLLLMHHLLTSPSQHPTDLPCGPVQATQPVQLPLTPSSECALTLAVIVKGNTHLEIPFLSKVCKNEAPAPNCLMLRSSSSKFVVFNIRITTGHLDGRHW